MITRPVALARGLLLAALVWGVGSAVTIGAFRLLGAQTTIADVSGQSDRVQIIWWGAHAFCACVSGLLGVAVGGTALTGARLARPAAATATLAAPVMVIGAVALGVLATAGVLSGELALASTAGLLTGVLGGAVYVLQTGVPEDRDDYYPAPRATGQSWGSR